MNFAGTTVAAVELKLHLRGVNCLAILPDNRTVVAGSEDGHLTTWDLETGARLGVFDNGGEAVNDLAISPCGRLMAVADDSCSVGFWDIATWAPVGRVAGHRALLRKVAFVSTEQVVAGDDDGYCGLSSLNQDCPVMAQLVHDDGIITALAVSPSGSTVVTAGTEGSVRAWDPSRTPMRPLHDHPLIEGEEYAQAAVFLDERRLVTSHFDELVLHDVRRGRVIARVRTPPPAAAPTLAGDTIYWPVIWDLAYASEARLLATAAYDVKLWDTDTWEVVRAFTQDEGGATALAISPDGRSLVSASGLR